MHFVCCIICIHTSKRLYIGVFLISWIKAPLHSWEVYLPFKSKRKLHDLDLCGGGGKRRSCMSPTFWIAERKKRKREARWDAWGRGGRGCNCSLNECFFWWEMEVTGHYMYKNACRCFEEPPPPPPPMLLPPRRRQIGARWEAAVNKSGLGLHV